MNPTILNLISRMSDFSYRPEELLEEGVFESGKTIFSDAYEEARNLVNKEFLRELYFFIDQENDSSKRNHSYFIIGNIAKNTNDLDGTKYLVESLSKEKDKKILLTILNLLPDLFKPLSIDLAPIYKLTTSRNWHVRGLSFSALTNTEHKIEGFLIDKLKATDNKDDIQYLLYAIQKVATIKSMNVVEPYLKNKSPGIKSTAQNVVVLIMIRESFSDIDIIKKLKLSNPSILIETFRERLSLLTKPGWQTLSLTIN